MTRPPIVLTAQQVADAFEAHALARFRLSAQPIDDLIDPILSEHGLAGSEWQVCRQGQTWTLEVMNGDLPEGTYEVPGWVRNLFGGG